MLELFAHAIPEPACVVKKRLRAQFPVVCHSESCLQTWVDKACLIGACEVAEEN